jgi:Polyketide cyclase / dehydrase and lipid transport
MKQLRGSAESDVAAPPEQCFAVLADVEGYPRWHSETVRQVEVIERDSYGRPRKIAATLHAEAGPLARDIHLVLAVALEPPRAVRLTRVPYEPTDPERFEVNWTVSDGQPARIQLELEAVLELPRLVPLGAIGDSLASGFVGAATRELTSGPGSVSPS